MICTDYNCKKVVGEGKCSVYSPEGQLFRDRHGVCPILGDGPNAKKTVVTDKKRAGQQKQKKKS